MNSLDAIKKMNLYGSKKEPFFFLISYNMESCEVLSPDEALTNNILFNFNNKYYNYSTETDRLKEISIVPSVVSLHDYERAFDRVQKHLHRGNSYLVNLTFPTPISTNETLNTIFHSAKAKYRVQCKNEFVVFSPESFIQINGREICTYPMKGTINAAIPNAESQLLDNHKEMAEHATIVDLLRNDLSLVATNVTVDKFRYIDTIKTADKNLLQVSSKISGTLPSDYRQNLGTIIFKLLPAGSICGAPKTKTLQIIDEAENYERGFYTGIAGYFDGNSLDSCVLIRFIENQHGQFVYKSGGGITNKSVLLNEYQELIDKIYVPIG